MKRNNFYSLLIERYELNEKQIVVKPVNELKFHVNIDRIGLDVSDFSAFIEKAHSSQLRFVQNGIELNEPLQDFDLINFDYVGLTVVLEGINLIDQRYEDIKFELETMLGFVVHMNLYYSAPNSIGFPVHSDQHDVLIIQLFGNKNWCVYPRSLDSSSFDCAIPFTLNTGNFLIIEKGLLHGAYTKKSSSIHLTIGFH